MTTISQRMGNLLKIGMYLLSLWLLFILIIVNKIAVPVCIHCQWANGAELLALAKNNFLPIVCVVLLFISAGFYLYFKRLIEESKDGPFEVQELENKNAENLVFLATYVIPLIGFGLETARQVADLAITLVVLAGIYVRTNLFYANPTLSLLGFKVYSAKIGGSVIILISREEIEVGGSINTLPLDRNVYFAKKTKRVGA
jgi:hypothetical protein